MGKTVRAVAVPTSSGSADRHECSAPLLVPRQKRTAETLFSIYSDPPGTPAAVPASPMPEGSPGEGDRPKSLGSAPGGLAQVPALPDTCFSSLIPARTVPMLGSPSGPRLLVWTVSGLTRLFWPLWSSPGCEVFKSQHRRGCSIL